MADRRKSKDSKADSGIERPAADGDEARQLQELQGVVDDARKRSRRTKKQAPAPADLADPRIEGYRKLAAALKRHGVFRSHKTIYEYATQDVRWEDAGFSKRGPWFENQLPALARWISEHYPSTKETGQPVEKPPKVKGDKDFAEASLDDVDKLLGKKDLAAVEKFARVKYIVEKAATQKLDRMIKEGKYVKREELEIADAKKRNAIKRGLEQLAKGMRQRLADITDPAAIETELIGAFRNLVNVGFGGRW